MAVSHGAPDVQGGVSSHVPRCQLWSQRIPNHLWSVQMHPVEMPQVHFRNKKQKFYRYFSICYAVWLGFACFCYFIGSPFNFKGYSAVDPPRFILLIYDFTCFPVNELSSRLASGFCDWRNGGKSQWFLMGLSLRCIKVSVVSIRPAGFLDATFWSRLMYDFMSEPEKRCWNARTSGGLGEWASIPISKFKSSSKMVNMQHLMKPAPSNCSSFWTGQGCRMALGEPVNIWALDPSNITHPI